MPLLTYIRVKILKELRVKNKDKIPIRILSPHPIIFQNDGFSLTGGIRRKALQIIRRSTAVDDAAIVIHIHGGGFLSMTSLAHKMYLEQWAKNLKMIHFAIDYRLAPENKYPAALDDVWQSYLWILNYAQSVLGSYYFASNLLLYRHQDLKGDFNRRLSWRKPSSW